jgi:hypothetical protein
MIITTIHCKAGEYLQRSSVIFEIKIASKFRKQAITSFFFQQIINNLMAPDLHTRGFFPKFVNGFAIYIHFFFIINPQNNGKLP